MKTKHNFWVGLVILVLCLGIMTTGIYAAKSAMLNIGGTLGFNMHNAMVEISGTISNIAIKDSQGAYQRTEKNITRGIMGGENTTTSEISLGEIMFCKGYEMIFELNFRNLGDTTIIGSMNLSYTNTKVNIVKDEKYDIFPASKRIAPGETVKLQFALKLSDQSQEISKFDFDMSIDFSELQIRSFDETQIQTIRANTVLAQHPSLTEEYLSYAERFPYYIEMGKQGDTSLRWLIVGVDNAGQLNSLSNEDKEAFANGYMPSKNYYLLSENVLFTKDSTDYKISFQNAYDYSTSLNTNYGVNANDYATSNIRDYLKGDTVKQESDIMGSPHTPTGDDINFFNTYTFTQNELNMIKERSLTDLYLDIITETASASQNKVPKVPTSQTTNTIDTTGDKFWLLSFTEMTTIFGDYENTDYHYSACCLVQGTTTGAYWWLRSPEPGQNGVACRMYPNGTDWAMHVRGSDGIRVAIKI